VKRSNKGGPNGRDPVAERPQLSVKWYITNYWYKYPRKQQKALASSPCAGCTFIINI